MKRIAILLALCLPMAAYADDHVLETPPALELKVNPAATMVDPTSLNVWYEESDGRVWITAPEDRQLTAFQIESPSRYFHECLGWSSPFDVCNEDRMFLVDLDGVDIFELGPIANIGLSEEQIINDWMINGASKGGGFFVGDGPYLIHSASFVPEPSFLAFLAMGLGTLLVRAFRWA